MADVVRTYLVTNSSALFGSGRRIILTSAETAGSVVLLKVDGRPVRVLLTGTPLPGHGRVFAAELDYYL
jgi:hypothetical protein